MVAPGCGDCTEATPESLARARSTRATDCLKAGSATVWRGELRTTINAELERPAKLRWIRARAFTDSEPLDCQPAPERAVSTLGAKAATATATSSQAIETARTWSVVQPPSRPSGPASTGCTETGACGGAVVASVLTDGSLSRFRRHARAEGKLDTSPRRRTATG